MADEAGTTTDSTDTGETETTDETSTDTTTTTDTVDLAAEVEKWKALSRKHEERAAANAEAARIVQELEEANKTEQQKLEERAAAAEAEANATKSELARLKAAVKYGLAEDDLDLLGTGTPDEIEERAEKLAARLAAATPPPSGPQPVPGLGKTPDTSPQGGSQLERDIREALGI